MNYTAYLCAIEAMKRRFIHNIMTQTTGYNVSVLFSIELFKSCRVNGIACSKDNNTLNITFEYLNDPQSNTIVKALKN